MDMPDAPILLDSITDVDPAHRGRVAVSGSHGGLYPAAVASRAGLRAVAFNDAGLGREDAGVAGVRALERIGVAAVAVDAMTAEIGSARDMIENGIISLANVHAHALGLTSGDQLGAVITRLDEALMSATSLDPVDEARWDERVSNELAVLCVDSASLIKPEDAGRIIVTGSHGGLIGGDPSRACKARARLVTFNDAGFGKNAVGVSRLPALDRQDVAAVTLACATCRIGDAASALADGVVSRVNVKASEMGLREGDRIGEAIARLG